MNIEIDINRPDLDNLLVDLELPIRGLYDQLDNLLCTIQDNCLIKDRDIYNIICGQLSMSVAGIEYIKKICYEYENDLEKYLEQKRQANS